MDHNIRPRDADSVITWYHTDHHWYYNCTGSDGLFCFSQRRVSRMARLRLTMREESYEDERVVKCGSLSLQPLCIS
jgi:hypothetical protein